MNNIACTLVEQMARLRRMILTPGGRVFIGVSASRAAEHQMETKVLDDFQDELGRLAHTRLRLKTTPCRYSPGLQQGML